tara:strand:+ start:889 stop:1263 length:375 start_codon:yes stop_codon:yes gene_type:complete
MLFHYKDRDSECFKNKSESMMYGCFVCFDNKDRYYGICRHCSLGVCLQKNCAESFPDIDNSEFLICNDCKVIIDNKLIPVDYTKYDIELEKIENEKNKKLLILAEKKRLAYKEILNILNSFTLK